ncbi:hypothetical protein H4219_005440 [Mycoemilia scoparia]|uniref:Uncharacterized protein n=1 Tax=Mycoemilia scoparia TaxID=417184 RepID=A0A9W7ZUK2_9FUNG|nr:hypothetical protein H4219_005440 [Mycoemilia scoparia]
MQKNWASELVHPLDSEPLVYKPCGEDPTCSRQKVTKADMEISCIIGGQHTSLQNINPWHKRLWTPPNLFTKLKRNRRDSSQCESKIDHDFFEELSTLSSGHVSFKQFTDNPFAKNPVKQVRRKPKMLFSSMEVSDGSTSQPLPLELERLSKKRNIDYDSISFLDEEEDIVHL